MILFAATTATNVLVALFSVALLVSGVVWKLRELRAAGRVARERRRDDRWVELARRCRSYAEALRCRGAVPR